MNAPLTNAELLKQELQDVHTKTKETPQQNHTFYISLLFIAYQLLSILSFLHADFIVKNSLDNWKSNMQKQSCNFQNINFSFHFGSYFASCYCSVGFGVYVGLANRNVFLRGLVVNF